MDEDIPLDRFGALEGLMARGVEGRQIIYPITQLPLYDDPACAGRFPVADRTVDRGLHLPTWSGLTREQVRHVCHSLVECLDAARPEQTAAAG
jgi:dTDP-4-amino-4,6-dideoxygalactose transaminase